MIGVYPFIPNHPYTCFLSAGLFIYIYVYVVGLMYMLIYIGYACYITPSDNIVTTKPTHFRAPL